MKIRSKTVVASTVSLICLMAILNIGLRIIINRGFTKIENANGAAQARRAAFTIGLATKSMDTQLVGWSAWDDTYQFMADKNRTYVESNLLNNAVGSMDLSAIMYYDTNGRLVQANASDVNAGKEIPLPQSLKDVIAPGSIFLDHKTTSSKFDGIVATTDGPVLLASRPITTSDYKGASRGTIVFARFLDAPMVERLSKEYALAFEVKQSNDVALPEDYQEAKKSLQPSADSYFVDVVNDSKVAAFAYVTDAINKPSFIVKTTLPRDAHAQGLVIINYMTIGLIVLGLAFLVVNVIWLERNVVGRLVALTDSLTATMDELGLR